VLANADPYDDIGSQHPLYALSATSDPDSMYFHEAMKAPDKGNFVEAMKEEVANHEEEGKSLVTNATIKGATRSASHPRSMGMRRKRRISTREVYKWKARLNFDGSKQVQGVNYWETFAPVATWGTIRMVLTMVLLNNWKTIQIDYVLAFPQAEVECDNMFMKIPKGFEVPDGKREDYVLKLKRTCTDKNKLGVCGTNTLCRSLSPLDSFRARLMSAYYIEGIAYMFCTRMIASWLVRTKKSCCRS
jgi:hypothetical protein